MSISFFRTLQCLIGTKLIDTKGLYVGYILKIKRITELTLEIQYYNLYAGYKFKRLLKSHYTKFIPQGISILDW